MEDVEHAELYSATSNYIYFESRGGSEKLFQDWLQDWKEYCLLELPTLIFFSKDENPSVDENSPPLWIYYRFITKYDAILYTLDPPALCNEIFQVMYRSHMTIVWNLENMCRLLICYANN